MQPFYPGHQHSRNRQEEEAERKRFEQRSDKKSDQLNDFNNNKTQNLNFQEQQSGFAEEKTISKQFQKKNYSNNIGGYNPKSAARNQYRYHSLAMGAGSTIRKPCLDFYLKDETTVLSLIKAASLEIRYLQSNRSYQRWKHRFNYGTKAKGGLNFEGKSKNKAKDERLARNETEMERSREILGGLERRIEEMDIPRTSYPWLDDEEFIFQCLNGLSVLDINNGEEDSRRSGSSSQGNLKSSSDFYQQKNPKNQVHEHREYKLTSSSLNFDLINNLVESRIDLNLKNQRFIKNFFGKSFLEKI